MWILTFVFLFITLLIVWNFFGYFIAIWLIGLFRNKPAPELPSSFNTKISLIIPCLNEEKQIVSKLNNIRNLSYPKNLLDVYFVDGGSTDNTLDLLTKEIKRDEQFKIIKCSARGKIQQINSILPQLKSEIIVNTDVDAYLSTDALEWIVAEFILCKDIFVVGAYCAPADGITIEKYYWSSQNKGRFLENDAKTSSIVIAQCYAFRQGFINSFPEDVVADDVYVSFLAHTKGKKVIYSRKAIARENRYPQTHLEFLPHKFRKSNAFLRESLRFVYLLPEMDHFCKVMFFTRLFQQLILPWAILFWVLLAGVLMTLFRYDIAMFGLALFSIFFLITSIIFHTVKLPNGEQKYSFIVMVKGYLLTLAVMLATGISYPFFRQGSNYARLKSRAS